MEIMDLRQFGRDAYNNCTQYSETENNDIIRNMIFSQCGELPAKKSQYRRWFKENSNKLFAIIEELVSGVRNDLSVDAFGDLVRVENFDLGDKKEFIIENTDLFKVGVIATGMNPTERQIQHDTKVSTVAFSLGCKIYAELFDFLVGKINWTRFVEKVAKSFDKKEATLVTRALLGAYDGINANFQAAINADGVNDKLRDIIAKVEANCGEKVQILGVKSALAKIENVSTLYNDDAKDRRAFGYVKVFEGTPVVELPNYFDKELGKFDIDDQVLLIVPAGEEIVVLGHEGDIEIEESLEGRVDKQIEMEMQERLHLGVLVSKTYGEIKITQ